MSAPSTDLPYPLLQRLTDDELSNLDHYLAVGGFARESLTLLEAVVRLRESGLRRRNGLGQPVFLEWWEFARFPQKGEMVADARLRDPESLVEPKLLTRDPYGLIEALHLAYLVSGVRKARLLLDPTLASMRPVMLDAMEDLARRGIPAGVDLDLEILLGPTPPMPLAEGQARLSHCLETWYQIRRILEHPGLGSEYAGHAATRLITVGGKVKRKGLVEVLMNRPLGQILDRAGGLDEKEPPKALALDSGVGGFLPVASGSLPLAPEEMMTAGVRPGFGTLFAVGPESCIVDLTRRALIRLAQLGDHPSESSRSLTWHAVRLTIQLSLRRGGPEAVEQLDGIAAQLERMGSPAAWPLVSSLRYFHDEWAAHAAGQSCVAFDCLRPLVAPCHSGCPAGIDIPSFMALVGQGKHREAVEVIRRDNPLPYICGLVCPAPCERSCLRGEMDQPISIRAMKAVAAKHALEQGGYPKPQVSLPTGKRVAVIGGGPAGLTAAYFLAIYGHEATLFEAQEVMGGTTYLGIPAYRLPREVIEAEVDAIAEAGVDIQTGKALGRDFTLDELKAQGYDAVFLGIGAHEGYTLGIEGEGDFPQVHDAITFLRNVSLGTQGAPADKVVVVGGGNAAMDAARTCRRLGCEVTISYRRTRGEMPAHDEEIDDALAEGIDIAFLTIPMEVVGENGQVTGLKCLRAELGPPDASGRRRPQPVAESNFIMPAGAVISAISQRPDLACLGPWAQDASLCAKTVYADPATGQTSLGWLFAGGDAVTGPATVVEAVAAGKRSALAMDAYLTGKTLELALGFPHPRARVEPIIMSAEEKIRLRRPEIPKLDPVARATTFDQAELGLDDAMGLNEAKRCLRCDLCMGCGLCQTACAEVGVNALILADTKADRGVVLDFHRAADKCIGCGSCANACPSGAIKLVDEEGKRKTTLAGTVLKEMELVKCSRCGQPYAPAAYLDQVAGRLDQRHKPLRLEQCICPQCARQNSARQQWSGRFASLK
ncbi:MAG: FAD-dependent oxidoreductase [Desulfarculaceae bacterium]|nr:FAD-dependent oxidoreductase [Desulfarculaceae bacterium]MCF8097644.1 FAD-dependent oxidoreductase [Desulfarculaceae bacterium]MCF8122838.1 FAD-dependent oxidoreductase [Desulfarculaceae bacterium]